MSKIQYVKIDDIAPAPYNPRKITDKQIAELKKSIQEVGFCVPIIINKSNNIIIAGHQRTKSARQLGYTEVPAIFVENIVKGDEIKFNQMHNGVEEKTFGNIVLTKNYPEEKFIEIDSSDFEIKNKNFSMPVVKEICNIIIKYGNVMSAVICSSEVVFANEYVYACKMLKEPVNAFICAKNKMNSIRYYFGQNYGEYSYEGIEKHTYVQGLAQMARSVEEKDGKRQNKSALYENFVFPYLAKKKDIHSIFDFGCGKAAYIDSLKKNYDALGLEFFNNNRTGIIVSKGNQMIDELIARIKIEPKFDVVVCDSVLNSVDSMKAEQSIMTCLNLFCKEKLFISGRCMESMLYKRNLKKNGDKVNNIYYPDADGLTATYRQGQWFFQKFHTEEQIHELMTKYGFEIINMSYGKINSTSFQCECKKIKDLSSEEYRKAIDFEFNLPLPYGKSYNRHEEVKKALGL